MQCPLCIRRAGLPCKSANDGGNGEWSEGGITRMHADYFTSSTFVVSSPNWLMTRTAIFWPFFTGNGWLLWP